MNYSRMFVVSVAKMANDCLFNNPSVYGREKGKKEHKRQERLHAKGTDFTFVLKEKDIAWREQLRRMKAETAASGV